MPRGRRPIIFISHPRHLHTSKYSGLFTPILVSCLLNWQWQGLLSVFTPGKRSTTCCKLSCIIVRRQPVLLGSVIIFVVSLS